MFFKRTLKPVLFILIIASFILTACEQIGLAPEEKKIATFIWTQEFDTLNPHYTQMWFSSVTHQLWNCWPWNFDENSNAVPLLVTEIPSVENGGISADSRTITLKLRDDIKWSDGKALTANDFVFTYEMVINPNNTVAGTNPYDLMESVVAQDDQTVVITFTEPFAPWLSTLYRGLLPEHILKPVFDKDGTIDNAEWNRQPTVGCGPYKFAEWESGSFARFTSNENYWLGRPKIDEITFRFVPDDAAQVAALKNKEGDLGTFVSYSDIPDLEKEGLKVVKVQSGYGEGIYFNLTENGHPALKDVRVRQAIAYATNREAISKDLLLGLTVPAATYWDNSPYSNPDNKPYPFDPEKAKGLLDEAGWVDSNGDGSRDKDGEELVLNYGTTTREIRKDTQAVLQQQLADVGIKVELLNYDSDQFFADFQNNGPTFTGELDIWEYSGSPSFPDPNAAEWLCSEVPTADNPAGINAQGCIPELDALLQLQSKQVDPAERTSTFHEITKMMVDQMYWLGLWQDPDIWVLSEKLQNVKLSGATPFFNIIEWDLGQ
jgi:peptide/nickel transport system substrate-binding protein